MLLVLSHPREPHSCPGEATRPGSLSRRSTTTTKRLRAAHGQGYYGDEPVDDHVLEELGLGRDPSDAMRRFYDGIPVG